MPLGVLNNIAALYAGNNLNATQAGLLKVLQRLSSGSRINSGADDAAGLAIADGLRANEASLTQSVQNASDGVGLLQTADGALAQVTDLLVRAVTLATEAANGTLSSSQVSSANQEYQGILQEIGNIGNTTNFNSNAVFSSQPVTFYVGDGTATGSNFYLDTVGALSITSVGESAPAASAGTALAPVVEAHAVTAPFFGRVNGTAGSQGYGVLTFGSPYDTVSGTIAYTDGTHAFSVSIAYGTAITDAIAQLNADSTFSANYTASTPSGNDLQIQNNANGVTNIVYTPGAIDFNYAFGTSTYTLANAADTLSGVLAYQQGTDNASISFAPGTTLEQAISEIDAAGSAFNTAGIVADPYSAGPTTLNLSNYSGNTANWGFASTYTGTTLTETQTIQQLGPPTVVNSSATAGSTATFDALEYPATDDVAGTLKVVAGSAGTPVTVQFISGTTLAAAVTQLNANAQLRAAGIFASATGGQLKLTGPLGTVGNPAGATLDTTGTLLFDTPAVPTAGVGTNFTSSALGTLTSGSSQNVLTGVNTAIANVAYQRGVLGAYANQLIAASGTAASENVNLTAAESSLRSTNYGDATADLAKYEVLSQMGISALAQANTVQKEILRLMQ